MAMDGTLLPVRIPLMGYSMFPLVRYNRDLVTIMPVTDIPEIGNIVLFPGRKKDLYVMHRVWDINDQMILTWGDNCPAPDRWIPIDMIWGKAVLIERGRKKIHPDPEKGMKWAKFWHQAGKVYRLYNRYKDGLDRRIKKLRREVSGENRT